MRRHARLSVVEERGRQRLYVEPLSSEGRVCVNGREISDKTLLRHGNRLLIGMNHFFRVNCPKVNFTLSLPGKMSLGHWIASYFVIAIIGLNIYIVRVVCYM
ncbi:hypothetical protein ANCDUO_15706 [Ancylostoma duodenale]|uniref:FHA domain-containing protein n=1 Tax=Ancylostoma duodenale TaxID=51022 RepID=A0A0C2CCU6_9BILA|nr:hypothetical protein ANCDUO_15706 [Ancylostoma duodenale]